MSRVKPIGPNTCINKERDSNFELLRIICMFFIVFQHIVCRNIDDKVGVLIFVFLQVTVNCFILISGYYSIKFSFKGLYKLFSICAFYAFVIYCLHLLVDGQRIGKSIIFNSIFVLSHSPWWFIQDYVILFLFSPILNSAINSMKHKQLLFSLSLLCFINLYFGWLWGGKVNPIGMNAFHFMFIYVIGRSIAVILSQKSLSRHYAIMVYFLSCMILFILGIWKGYYGENNDPIVLIASISFFLFFKTLSFSSKIINYIASSSLSVYLIHENPYVGACHYYPAVSNIMSSCPHMWRYIIMFLIAMFTYVCCIGLDQIRKIIMRPFDAIGYVFCSKLDQKCHLWFVR